MTDKVFEARKRYEEMRNEKLFGTKSPYIYRILRLPVLVCQTEGDMWATIEPIKPEVRFRDGRSLCRYRLEVYVVSFDGVRYFKFPVYIPSHTKPEYYNRNIQKYFYKRLNPIFIK